MIPLTILLLLFGFLLLYFAADALHDVWVLKERSYYANSMRSDISDESRERFTRLAKSYSQKWHALDAFIKGMVVVALTYAMFGVDWLLLVLLPIWAMSLRWLWFDACWNWFAGKSFWYRGSVAKTDTLKLKNWAYFMLKFVLFITTSYLVFNLK